MWLCFYAIKRSLRSFANGIRACLGTRFRMVGFALVTTLRVSTVRGCGALVSTTWQDLQKSLLTPTAYCNTHTRDMEPFTAL